MKKTFQLIIIASLVLQAVWLILPFSWEYIYHGDQLELLSWNTYGAFINTSGIAPYLMFAVYIISSAGLFTLKKWGRVLFLCLTVFSIIGTPIWGISVSPPLDSSIGYIVSLCDGAILTIAYLTHLATEFN